MPGHTKCLLYASSIFGSAFFEKRSRFLGPFPQRMYVVKEGISLRSWAWNRKIRRTRERRVRLPVTTRSKYGTRPRRRPRDARV